MTKHWRGADFVEGFIKSKLPSSESAAQAANAKAAAKPPVIEPTAVG